MRAMSWLARGVFFLAAAAATAQAQPSETVELLHAFHAAPANPIGGLATAADGGFYGMTDRVLYRLTAAGALTVAHTFGPSTLGVGAPTIGPDGVVYGVLAQAGRASVFRFEPATSTFRILRTFDGARDGSIAIEAEYRATGPLRLASDGFLYGTTNGKSASTHGSVFRVHPVTGAGATIFRFSGAAPALREPVGGVVEVSGQLYAAAERGGAADMGGIYRLDPATGSVSTIHLFSGATGRNPQVGLSRTADGWIYGTAFMNLSGGSSTSGTHAFRFDPQAPTIAVTVVAEVGVEPSELVEAGDGHLYGVTSQNPRVFRIRRQAGGVHTVEPVHDAVVATDGTDAAPGALAIGADGFLYGTALREGSQRSGTVFRFDPLEGGGGGNPSQFSVIHAFPQTGHQWLPSVPVRATNGDFYGTLSRGGATLHGAIYRMSAETGAVTIVGPVPGTPHPQWPAGRNSPLVAAPDGFLYGLAHQYEGPSQLVRVDPATDAITAADTGAFAPDSVLTLSAGGDLYTMSRGSAYLLNRSGSSAGVAVGTLTTSVGSITHSALVLGPNSQFYAIAVYVEPRFGSFQNRAELVRLDLVTNTFVTVASIGPLGGSPLNPPVPGTPFEWAGTMLVPVRDSLGVTSTFRVLPNGQPTVVCEVPSGLAAARSFPTLFTQGTVYSVDGGRLRTCDPSRGFTPSRPLPDSVGDARGVPQFTHIGLLAAASGGLYGGGTIFRLPTGAAFDTDGDGLSNLFETTNGLDPFSTTHGNGGADDPDGDGRTNAQELAEGTHPRGFSTRYFAEGVAGTFFTTRFDLTNPNVGDAIVRLGFLTDRGQRFSQTLILEGGTHATVETFGNSQLLSSPFSTIVEADVTIGVDRTMAWDLGRYGSHIETGVVAPSATWYLAEGSTSGPFSLFYLLQNPQSTSVEATVRYLRPLGLPPIERTYTLLPYSRRTVVVDDETELASTDVSAVITAPSPIVAERAMYYSQPGQAFAAGHGSAGVTAPALEWFLAEGATGTFFDLFVLIANPGTTAATVDVDYLLIGGGRLTKTYTVAASSRMTIWVDDEQLPAGSGVKPLANAALSMVVRSTNDVPIVVERTMWWPGPELTTDFWYEAHNSPGATTTATRWIVGGGENAGEDSAQTYVLIANPTDTPGRARVTVIDANGSRTLTELDLPARSRTNAPIASPSVSVANTFGVLVESLGSTPVPIVVERATYTSPGGLTWASGGNTLGSPLP